MTVVNTQTAKPILKVTGPPTEIAGSGSIWCADFMALLLANIPNFHIFDIVVSNSPPPITKLWFDPAGVNSISAQDAQGQLRIWDISTTQWVPCTPERFARHLASLVVVGNYTEANAAPVNVNVGHIWRNTNVITVAGIPAGLKAIWRGDAWVLLADTPYFVQETII